MTEKFIRTFYNDEKVVMRITGCQFCPLMTFNIDRFKCSCRTFSNEMQDSTVDLFVIDYKDNGIVQDNIKIPKWCLLSNSIDDLIKNRITYRIFPNGLLINHCDYCDDNELEFIDVEKLRNEEDAVMEEFMSRLSQKSNNSNPKNFIDKEIDIHKDFNDIGFNDSVSTEYSEEKYEFQTPIKKQEICSICGQENETVERNNNIGMCDNCWNIYQNDDKKKKQAFINNFRMKRNQKFLKESFKIIDIINIK